MTLLQHARELAKSPTIQILVALMGQNIFLHVLLGTQAQQQLSSDINTLTAAMAGITLLATHRMRGIDVLADSLRRINSALERRIATHTTELAEVSEALAIENVERERIERRLAEEVTQDALTGLANRRRFLILLDELVTQNKENAYAIFFIDIDHFKLINDGLGHALGDRALIAIADRLDHALGGSTVTARVGGDEFALVTLVNDRAAAESTAERILSVLKNPIAISERIVYSAASIGVRYCEKGTEAGSSLLRDAHTAMNRAKLGGRGRYVLFDAQMQTEVQQRFTLDVDLRQAVERDQFFVEYQPIFSLLDGRPTGYEALVRWAHPHRGRIEPGVFIPAAEDSGLVISIGLTVLREACAEIARRGLTSTTPIGINLSARQIEQPDIVDQVRSAILDSGISPASIMLEVTESVFVENLQAARDVLRSFKELGVLIAIDDFGTGYSSLSYLQELPFDVLKVDRSFVRRIDEEATSRDIVRMIVTLAESLHMTVVAEGIETEEQLFWVRNAGCLKGQGFLFSRPLPPEKAFAVTAMPAASIA